MNYVILAAQWFPVLLIGGIAWLIGWTATHPYKFHAIKPDPRWKNKNEIVDFTFSTFTILTTSIVMIMGYLA